MLRANRTAAQSFSAIAPFRDGALMQFGVFGLESDPMRRVAPLSPLVPAQAGIQFFSFTRISRWVPAFAGTSGKCVAGDSLDSD